MNRAAPLFALLVVALGLVAAGCGGGSDEVPASAVAVVNGTEIARTELDELLDQTKKTYGDSFPKVGTPERQTLEQQLVAFLVQREQFEQEAAELGIEIKDADLDKARSDLIETRFDGDEKKFEASVEEQGLTEESLAETLRVYVLSQKLFEVVTKDVKVSDQDALAYFTQNQEQYGTPDSRDVRHILVKETTANGEIDFEKSKAEAERVYRQLQDGADFASLAKEISDDPGTKADGGKYAAVRGQSVAEFDEIAFELDTNEISRPVRTQFGYHVIQATADIKPGKATPFEDVKAGIKATLLQSKRDETMTEWIEELAKRYEDKVSYAVGLAPPAVPDAPTETQ
jgi:peptidyl-prolyl cis-trans isomerase C